MKPYLVLYREGKQTYYEFTYNKVSSVLLDRG